MDVIRKTAGEMIDQLTEELEIILEEKQKTELHDKYGILVDALEAALSLIHIFTSDDLKEVLYKRTQIHLHNNQFKEAMLINGFWPRDPSELNWVFPVSYTHLGLAALFLQKMEVLQWQ